MKRKVLALIMLAAFSANMVSCGLGDKVKDKKSGTSSSQEDKKATTKNVDTEKIKEKYKAQEKSDYTDAIYNLERNHKFIFDVSYDALKKYDEDLSQIYTIATDADGKGVVNAQISITEDNKLEIKPPNLPVFYNKDDALESTTDLDVNDFDVEVSRENDLDWGNANNYYLIKKVDTKTGNPLEKPEVTVFTIKGELDAPTAKFEMSDKGRASLSWSKVDGASDYIVCRIFEDEDGRRSISEMSKTKETNFDDFLMGILDFDGGVIRTNGEFDVTKLEEDESTGKYCIMAIAEDKKSVISNVLDVSEFAKSVPIEFDSDRNEEYFDAMGSLDKEKPFEEASSEILRNFPTHLYVRMGDGNSVKVPIDFDLEYFEPKTHEKYGLYANIRYKARGTSLISTYPIIISEDEDSERKRVLGILKELQEKQEKLEFKGLNSEVDIDIETTPPKDYENENSDDVQEGETDDKDNDTDDNADNDGQSVSVEETEYEVYASSALSEYLATAMLSNTEIINLDDFKEATNKELLIDALYEAMYQNPLVMKVNKIGFDYAKNNLILEYAQTREEQEKMQKEVVAEVDKVIKEIITDDMTDIQKEFAINDYLCKNAEYDFDALDNAVANNMVPDEKFDDSFTPYGVLINKVGVCASYASSFKLLADAAGLDSIVVTGNLNGNLPHAWNRILVDGQWITIDSTNNDIEETPNALANLSDDMAREILVEDDSYVLNEKIGSFAADSNDLEYYKVNGAYFETEAELVEEIVKQIAQDKTAYVRTDANISEAEVVKIIQLAQETGKFEITEAYTWLGVITVKAK